MKILLPIFFILFWTSVSPAQPSILFERTVFDFGAVGHETPLKHTFEFSNSGDRELLIEKISAS